MGKSKPVIPRSHHSSYSQRRQKLSNAKHTAKMTINRGDKESQNNAYTLINIAPFSTMNFGSLEMDYYLNKESLQFLIIFRDFFRGRESK